MRIAAAQIVTTKDTEQNLETVRQWIQRAAAAGAELVVFPEAVQRAFGHNLTSIAESTSGQWAQRVRDIAREHQLVAVMGMFTPGQPGEDGKERVRNTLLVTGADHDGESVDTSYNKVHLYDAFGFEESRTVEAGTGPVSFNLGEARFGLATCYDVRFPQLFQTYARAGSHATLLPASWGAGVGKVEQWQLLARARALDSTQYVIACGQGLPEAAGVEAVEGAPTGVGHSMMVAPDGTVLAQAGEEPELLVADLDLDRVASVRQSLPVLANARKL